MRVSHLAALATLVALLGAMFAALPSAGAAPSLVVTTSDSDNTIKAGEAVDILAYVKDGDDGASYFLDYALASNGVIYTATVAVNGPVDGTAAAPTTLGTLLAPTSASGEYTVGVRVRNAASVDAATAFVPGEVTIMVGEVGDAIGSVEISLGKAGHGTLPKTATDKDTTPAYGATQPTNYEACQDASTADVPDTAVSANCIAITVDVKNSLGNPANNGDVTTVHVFAALADVYVPPTAAAAPNSGEFAAEATTGASTKFFIAKEKPGTVDVYAIAIGPSGSATSTPLPLKFTGEAAALTLSAPSGPLAQSGSFAVEDKESTTEEDESVPASNVITLEATASDDSGNAASLTATLYTVTDGITDRASAATPGDISDSAVAITDAEGSDEEDITARVDQKKDSSTTVVISLAADTTTKPDPGEYTVTVTFLEKEYTAKIVVAGDADGVALETEWDENDILTVTATVTDAGGNLLPDKQKVMFNAVGDLDLRALGRNADGTTATAGSITLELNDGVAKARFAAIKDSGSAKVIATAVSNGVNGVAKVTLGDTEEEAMPVEEASVGCLSSLAGFATWSCGVDSSASEIFGLVEGRGATAIHLWNGTAWVRYSVVDSTMVPGSSDFMVTENDILYISN